MGGAFFYKRLGIACAVGAVLLAGVLLGAVRTQLFLGGLERASLAPHVGQGAEIVGVVVDDIDRRDSSLRVTVRVEAVNGIAPASTRGRIIAILPRDTELAYGDRVTLRGALALPQSFETNTGRLFDYSSYLRVRRISAIMRFASVEAKEEGTFTIIGTLFSAKHMFERALEKVFVEPQGALMEGILLGERRGIPAELNQSFIVSGLVHVVVLSGYNISIVAEWVMKLFAALPRSVGFSSGAVVIILFAIATGGSATAVRACIMALIAILARTMGRSAVALRSLGLAVIGMVLWNPLSLLFDPSFILSVLATFGLITISPAVEKKLAWMPEKFGLRSIAASTLSVQFFVLPALLYFTGVLSFVSLPANILALPVVPLAMLMGFLAGMLALVHPLLGFVPGLVSDLLLRFMIFVAQTATALPFSSTVVPQFSAWIVAACYVPLTTLAIWLYTKETRIDIH